MTDLATIRIPVDSSDMVQAVRESKSLERGIKMLVEAFDAGAIGSSQLTKGLSQLANEFKKIFTSSEQASNSVEGFANSLMQSKAAADAATASKQALTLATQKAETAFALANQKAKEELQLSRARADFALAMGLQREREAEKAVAAADMQAQAEKRLAQEILKRRNAQEQAAAQKAQNFQAQVGPNLGLGAQGISAGASASAMEGEIENLRIKYDQLYVAQVLYKKTESELRMVEGLGIISKNKMAQEIEQLKIEYQQYITTADRATLANNRFAEHINQTSGRMNQFGTIAQQTGYQVSDFFVQVQGGTNPLVAFSQQATQLAGLLYLLPERFMAARIGMMGFSVGMGAIIAGVTIVIPLLAMLAMSFFNSKSKAEESAKGVDTYKEALSALTSEIQSNQDAFLKFKFDTLSVGTAKSRQEMERLRSEISTVTEQLNTYRETLRNMGPEGAIFSLFSGDFGKDDLEALLADLEKQLSVLEAQDEAQRMLNGGLSTAAGIQKGIVYDTEVQLRLARELKEINSQVKEGLVDPQKNLAIQREYQALLQAGVKPVEAQAEAQYKVERALIQAKIASGQLTNEQNVAAQASLRILDATFAIEDQIRRSATETSLLEEGLSQSVIDALKLEGVDLTNLSDGALSAAALATNLGISLGLAREIGKISALSPEDRSIYTGVKTGVLPDVALGSIGMGVSGFTNDANAPIEIPGVMTPNPDKPKKGGDKKDPLGDLQKQLELERELLGTSEAYQKVRQALGDDFRKTSPEVIAGLVQQATEIERLIELEEQRKSIMDTVKSSLEDGFMSMVDGTKSVKDAFKSMAAEIIKELYRVYVVQRIVGAISGAFGGGGGGFFSAPATGSFGLPFGGPMASGGPVDPNKVYLVGEKGPELVIPRQSGTVVNAAQTAQAMGKGSGDVTVNNNISVTGSDAAMVRAEVAKMIPQITNATKAAVIDARLRGGQMKQAFR
jgi:hypothetical protein